MEIVKGSTEENWDGKEKIQLDGTMAKTPEVLHLVGLDLRMKGLDPQSEIEEGTGCSRDVVLRRKLRVPWTVTLTNGRVMEMSGVKRAVGGCQKETVDFLGTPAKT